MKRNVRIALGLGILLPGFLIICGQGEVRSATPAARNAASTPATEIAQADPSLVTEVARLVEASLEALRDGRDHQHQAFLKESLEKLGNFSPARWHSGYVRLEGRWVHIDQAPYVTAESPALKTYSELREKADARHFPKSTTVSASRDRLLESKQNEQVVDGDKSSQRILMKTPWRRLTLTIPGTETNWERTRRTQQVDIFARESVRLTNSAGYSPGYARAQESLARWCVQNGLLEEARVHWAHLLKAEPANREAARGLGLVEHRGRFFTKEQVARAVRQEKDVARSLEDWREKLAKLQREAASLDEARRKAALHQLGEIDDPNAVYALEAIALWQTVQNEQRSEFVEAFDQQVVAVIRKFNDPPATESLVRFAILHDQQRVRQAAADALKTREPHSFVPLLLAGLALPIQYDAKIVENERGEKQFQAGALQEHHSHIAGMRDTTQVYNGWHLRILKTSALARMKQLQDFNLQADALNRRIAATLLRSMKIDPDGNYKDLALATEYDTPDPKRWWQWWHDYNEQYVSGNKPFYGYEYDWRPTYAYTQNEVTRPQRSYALDWSPPPSCFGKGTLVWTLSGAKPVEEIKIGDRVLAQHPETGELAYKGVLMTTTRPPSEMLTIRAGKTAVTTTLGHPFFVVGKGWRMAKQLKEDDWIAGEGRTLRIRRIEKAEPVEAYNLVVADFGTYFVGEDRIYVHDNSPLPPTRLDMPGLLAAAR
jgi:hypothetical protein